MPGINKIRLSNIRYSHGEKFYDDIILNAGDRSFIIDYINGGGKTFLAQCMMQSILPNSKFTTKHPLSEVFDNENKNKTIHSMIEWKLDKGMGYDFLITGFCARKKDAHSKTDNVQEDVEGNSSFDYFNYVYFYNKNSTYSIDNIPLKEEINGVVKRMNYTELKTFLRGLNPKELSEDCYAQIFNVKRDYHKLLKDFRINSNEWELLREVNHKEAYIPTYFEKYSTSRRFIQDFLIPQIDNSNKLNNQGDYQSGVDRAESLLDIKDTLIKFKKRKDNMKELDFIENSLKSLVDIDKKLLKLYNDRDEIKVNVVKGYNKISLDIKNTQDEIDSMENKILEISNNQELLESEKDLCNMNIIEVKDSILLNKSNLKTFNMFKDSILISDKLKERSEKELELQLLEEDIKGYNEKLKELESLEFRYNAENKFIDYLAEKSLLAENEAIKENYKKSQEELLEKLNYDGGRYKFLLEKEKSGFKKAIEEINFDIKNMQNELKSIREKRDLSLSNISNLKSRISSLGNDINNLDKERLDFINNLITILKGLDNSNTSINRYRNESISLLNNIKSSSDDISNVNILNENMEHMSCISYAMDKIENMFKVINIIDTKTNQDKQYLNSLYEEILFLQNNLDVNLDTKNVNSSLSSIDNIDNMKNNFSSLLKDLKKSFQLLLSNIESSVKNIQSENNSIDINLATNNQQIKELKRLIDYTSSNISKKEALILKYDNHKNSLTPLLEKYAVSDLYILEENLNNLIISENSELKTLENNKKSLLEDIDNLKKHKGITLNNKIFDCLNKIKSKYNSALIGVEFIKTLSPEDREFYLRKTDSLIAYSILLNNDDFTKLMSDDSTIENYKDDLIIFINIDSIKSNCTDIISSNIYISKRSVDEILDEDRMKMEISKKEDELFNLTSDISIKFNTVEVLKEDLNEVREFIREYKLCYREDLVEDIESLKSNVLEYTDKISMLEDNSTNLKLNKSVNMKNISSFENLTSKINNFSELIERGYLLVINTLSEADSYIKSENEINYNLSHIDEIYLSKKDVLDEINLINKEINLISDEIKLIDSKISTLDSENYSKVGKVAELSSSMETLSKSILKLNYESIECSNLSLIEAEKIYEVTENDSKGKLSDLNRINAEITRIKERMNNISKEISKFGYKVSDFESNQITIVKHSDAEFENISNRKNNLVLNIDNKRKEIKHVDRLISETNGTINTLKTQLLNKYKTKFEDVKVPGDVDIDSEIINLKNESSILKNKLDDIENNIIEIDEKIKNDNISIRKLNKEKDSKNKVIIDLEKKKSNVENLISIESINIYCTSECAKDLKYVNSGAEKDLKTNDSFIRDSIYKHQEKIKSAKIKLADSTFNFVDDLNEIKAPNDKESASTQIEDIVGEYGYLYLLEEEKSSLEKEISALEEHQNSFIDLCVQRAVYAYDKIMEIEDFSKVKIGDKRQETIRIKLSLLTEEERHIKMTNYISKILNNIDENENKDDSIKTLSNQLELQHLFPQILSSIDSSTIEIFKINETCDGGKFLKWGKAGSTGQTNSMYVFLFMCIMTYIRKLSSFNIKDESRQVIFLDNPFAGTTAINLWKIPIELMAKNNIQFMCLGYEVPPQLTGMFDVRYSLGGVKMSNQIESVEVVREEALSRKDKDNLIRDIFEVKSVEEEYKE